MTRKTFLTAAAIIAVFTAAGFSQYPMDTAYVPVVLNQTATIVVEAPSDAPSGARPRSESTNVTISANQTRTLILLLGPTTTSISHLAPKKQADVSATVSQNRGSVLLTLQPQAFANAEISLHSMSGKRILRTNTTQHNTGDTRSMGAANSGSNISRPNVAPGVYMLSVKGTAGNTFSAKISHNGGRLSINTVFAGSPSLNNKTAAVAGAWTISATATNGGAIKSEIFHPRKGRENDTIKINFENAIVPFNDTTDINLQGSTASFTGRNVNIVQDNNYGTIVEITADGIYRVQGTLNNGFLSVSKRDLKPTIILNGANITSQRYSALVSLKKSDITLILAAGSNNTLKDNGQGASGGKYALGYDPEEQPNATLNIRNDLTIKGSGKLTVTAGLNNGIGSRANLIIEGGDITVTAPNNALKGNDLIEISGGTLNLTSKEDAMKTEEHDTDKTRGDIKISGGNITIQSDQDGIQSARNLTIENATIKVTAGVSGGSSRGSNASPRPAATSSACRSNPNSTDCASSKGLKAVRNITIKSGTINISSRDDGIHADDDITIDGGTITVATSSNYSQSDCSGGGGGGGGDGIKARRRTTINDGVVNVTKSFEGIEGFYITINGGKVSVTADNDGINASDSLENGCPSSAICCLITGSITIKGGEVFVNSRSDALDSNGDLKIEGGTVVAFGPGGNCVQESIDVDGKFTITGGTLIAAGSDNSCMQKAPENNGTTQRAVYVILGSGQQIAANTIVNVRSNNNQVVAFRTMEGKSSVRLVVTSPLITTGNLEISTGGNHTGTMNNMRIFTGGTYSGGTQLRSINVSGNNVTVDGRCNGMSFTCCVSGQSCNTGGGGWW